MQQTITNRSFRPKEVCLLKRTYDLWCPPSIPKNTSRESSRALALPLTNLCPPMSFESLMSNKKKIYGAFRADQFDSHTTCCGRKNERENCDAECCVKINETTDRKKTEMEFSKARLQQRLFIVGLSIIEEV